MCMVDRDVRAADMAEVGVIVAQRQPSRPGATSGPSMLNKDQIAGAAPGWQGATTENTGSI